MPVTRRFFFGSLALPAFSADKPVVRPNLILITADYLPAWVVGCYGNKEIRTPGLDRLAQMGTRFQRHFTGAPAPQPGRDTLLTGRTPMQSGAAGSLDSVLSAAGYSVASTDPAGAGAAIDAAAPGKPFFVHAAHSGLRPPFDGVPQKFHDLYGQARFQTFAPDPASPRARAGKELLADLTGNLRRYAAAVSALDEQVQAIVNKVYQRKIQDDTAIIFTSTCGALLGRHGIWAAGDGSDPANMYEEAVSTPMLISWVGDVPAQAVRPEVVSAYDLLPTLVEIAGGAMPPNRCGRSYLALATGKPLPRKQPWPTTVLARLESTEMARMERYKLVLREQGNGPGELYDERTDPGEKVNQYNSGEFVTVRNSLTAALNSWRQKYSA